MICCHRKKRRRSYQVTENDAYVNNYGEFLAIENVSQSTNDTVKSIYGRETTSSPVVKKTFTTKSNEPTIKEEFELSQVDEGQSSVNCETSKPNGSSVVVNEGRESDAQKVTKRFQIKFKKPNLPKASLKSEKNKQKENMKDKKGNKEDGIDFDEDENDREIKCKDGDLTKISGDSDGTKDEEMDNEKEKLKWKEKLKIKLSKSKKEASFVDKLESEKLQDIGESSRGEIGNSVGKLGDNIDHIKNDTSDAADITVCKHENNENVKDEENDSIIPGILQAEGSTTQDQYVRNRFFEKSPRSKKRSIKSVKKYLKKKVINGHVQVVKEIEEEEENADDNDGGESIKVTKDKTNETQTTRGLDEPGDKETEKEKEQKKKRRKLKLKKKLKDNKHREEGCDEQVDEETVKEKDQKKERRKLKLKKKLKDYKYGEEGYEKNEQLEGNCKRKEKLKRKEEKQKFLKNHKIKPEDIRKKNKKGKDIIKKEGKLNEKENIVPKIVIDDACDRKGN